jgi:uncharacterized membrane protein
MFEGDKTMMEVSKTNLVKQHEPDVECSLWIERPPEEIWDYLADVSNEPQWRDIMIEARWVTNPPHGVGSTGLNVVKGVGDWPWKVTEWEEHRSVSWVVTGGRFAGSHAGYRVAPENAGSRVTLDVQFKSSTFMRVVRPYFRRLMRRQFVAELTKLKAIMEA